MNDLSTSSRIAAGDLRRAERSIARATRDTAQFLVTAIDITEAHELSPTFAQATSAWPATRNCVVFCGTASSGLPDLTISSPARCFIS